MPTPEELQQADKRFTESMAAAKLSRTQLATCRNQFDPLTPEKKVECSLVMAKVANKDAVTGNFQAHLRVYVRTITVCGLLANLEKHHMPGVHIAMLPPPDRHGNYHQKASTRANHLARLAFMKAKMLEMAHVAPEKAEEQAKELVNHALPDLPVPTCVVGVKDVETAKDTKKSKKDENPWDKYGILSSKRRREIREILPNLFGHEPYLLAFVQLVVAMLDANGGHFTGLPQTRLKELLPKPPATPEMLFLTKDEAGGGSKNLAHWTFYGCEQQLDGFLKAHRWQNNENNPFLADPYLLNGMSVTPETMSSIWTTIQRALKLPFQPGPRAYRRVRIVRGIVNGESRDDIRMAVGQDSPTATHLYAYFDDESIPALARTMDYAWTLNSVPCPKCDFSLGAATMMCPRCKHNMAATTDPDEAKLSAFLRAVRSLDDPAGASE